MTLSEIVNPIIPPAIDQALIIAMLIGIAAWLIGIALFFLLLYAVIVTAIKRGMRDHQLWLEGRDRVRTVTAPQNLR